MQKHIAIKVDNKEEGLKLIKQFGDGMIVENIFATYVVFEEGSTPFMPDAYLTEFKKRLQGLTVVGNYDKSKASNLPPTTPRYFSDESK